MSEYIEIEVFQEFPKEELDLILHLKVKDTSCSVDVVDPFTGDVSCVDHTLFSTFEWEGVTGTIIDGICEFLKELQ